MMTVKRTKVKKIDLHVDKADVVKQEVCSRDEVHACRKERFVIFNEELAGGRERVKTEEVRVQRGGWREIRLCR